MQIIWTMTPDQANEYLELCRLKENYEISDEEWLEQVMSMDGYPLTGQPDEGDELILSVDARTQVSVPGVTH